MYTKHMWSSRVAVRSTYLSWLFTCFMRGEGSIAQVGGSIHPDVHNELFQVDQKSVQEHLLADGEVLVEQLHRSAFHALDRLEVLVTSKNQRRNGIPRFGMFQHHAVGQAWLETDHEPGCFMLSGPKRPLLPNV